MLRSVIAVIAGIAVGAVIVFAVETIGHLLWPSLTAIDADDPEQMKRLVAATPFGAKLAVVVGWFAGAFVGATVALLLARRWAPVAWIVAGTFLGLAAMNFIAIPHPLWMQAAAVVVCAAARQQETVRMTAAPLPAAGLILLRDAPSLEVLLTERDAAIAFAGGALVFPGGRVDPADADPQWADHADGWNALADDERAAAVAAIREAFEEAGVLLARDVDGAFCDDARIVALLARWRPPLVQTNSAFMTMMRDERLRLALDILTPFARWIAPPGVHKRFDTRFFAAAEPVTMTPRADGREASRAFWRSPAVVVADHDAGRVKLIFPTRRKLELLALGDTAAATLAAAATRKVAPIMPSMHMRDGEMWLTIPKDQGYPVTEERLSASTRG